MHARRFLHVRNEPIDARIAGVREQADPAGLGARLEEQVEALAGEIGDQIAHAGGVAVRPGEAGDQAECHRIAADAEHGRDRRAGLLCRLHGRGAADRRQHIDLALDELGRQRGQSLVPIVRPPMLDRHALSCDIALVAQSLVKGVHVWRVRSGHPGVKPADHRYGLLLGGEPQWPNQ